MPNRVAIVRGLRTPFAKSGTSYARLTALDLGKMVVAELIERSGIDPKTVQEVVFGNVIPSVKAPNIAREIVLGTALPREIPGYTVGKACASANQAIAAAADMIFRGYADTVIAGGSESLSDIPILFSRNMSEALTGASKAKGVAAKLGAFKKVRPKDLVPDAPADSSVRWGSKLVVSTDVGIFATSYGGPGNWVRIGTGQPAAPSVDLAVVPPSYEAVVGTDNLIRADTTFEALSKLRPVFDRNYGTITAGNSSPLTDGAAAVLLMSEEKAKAEGFTPIGYLKAYAFAATDPFDQLLQGPVFALPLALQRAGISLKDIGVIEMHEAFAAQVLSNIQWMGSKKIAEEKLGRSEPIGDIDPQQINRTGGSIALGHPFGATGARIVTTVCNELQRTGEQYGLVTVCAAGGMGAAMVLERE